MYPVFGLKVLYGSVVAILSLNEVEFVLARRRVVLYASLADDCMARLCRRLTPHIVWIGLKSVLCLL